MKMNRKLSKQTRVAFQSILLLLVITLAKGEYGGGYTGSSFRYGNNARAIALSNAMVAEPNQGFQQFANPAMIIEVENMEFGVSLFAMSLNRSIQTLSFSRVLPPKGAIGLTLFRSGTNNIQGRNLLGQKTELMSVHDSYGMLTFGLQLSHRFSAGFNFKAMFNDIEKELDGKGVAIDLGILYRFRENLTFGAQITNVMGKTDWNNNGLVVEEELPQTLSLGAAYALLPELRIMGQYEVYLVKDHGNEGLLKLAAEARYAEMFFFRGGISASKTLANSSEKESDLDYSFGIGILYPILMKSVRIDYTIDPGNKGEGLSHLISWSFLI